MVSMKKTGDMKKFYHYSFPMQAALLTVQTENKNTNVITVAWHTTISKKPPLYGVSIAPGRYSHGLIEESKEFVINFASYDIGDKIHFCGAHTGRNTDKIKETGFTLLDCNKINTKYIKECFAHLECKLYDKINLGDHTFFVGEIVNTIIDEEAFLNDILDTKKVKPCYYLGDSYYTTVSGEKKGF